MPSLVDSNTDGGHGSMASHRMLTGEDTSMGSGGSRMDGAQVSPAVLAGHVMVVSILMVLGKMFPTVCYRNEANLRTRFALSIGMCPRGEVGAGVIVISLGFGIGGMAISIAVIALAVNLILSSGFIMAVKHLARGPMDKVVPFRPPDAAISSAGSTPVLPFTDSDGLDRNHGDCELGPVRKEKCGEDVETVTDA